MIKCDGFGKLLKPLFSILLIGFFGLLGGFSVNATFQHFEVGLDKFPSVWNTQFDVGILKKGRFLSSYIGSSKALIGLNHQFLIFWNNNGLYLYNVLGDKYLPLVQGYFSYYKVCDEILLDTTGDSLQNCDSPTSFNYNNDEISSNFISSLDSGDIVFIIDSISRINLNYDTRYTIDVCFSSSSIGKTLCYIANVTSNPASLISPYPLSNSLGFSNDVRFNSINLNLLNNPPGFSYGGEINGSLNVDSSSVITGDYTYSTCTVGQVIDELESNGYTSYVCYGGLDNFNDWDSSQIYNIIPGTGLRLSQILSYSSVWDTPQDWFDYWNGLYGDDKFNAMWESYPAVYHTWFDLYYKYTPNKYFDYVREYCNMKVDLNLDLNSVYKGQYFKGVCDTIIDKQIYNYGNTTSGGEVLQGVNWGFNSSQSINNPIEFIQNYFNLLKSKINLDYSDSIIGFLPKYIIGFLIALILFRFISH